jgi:uncharacterized protein (DUF1697 family)
MPCFVAFIRGINVGGHTVTKVTLQEAFSSMGFNSISTFRQSGNIIFEAASQEPKTLEIQIQTRLQERLPFQVAVFVRTIPQLKRLIELYPFKGEEEADADFQITFLKEARRPFPLKLPVRIPNSTADVISVRDEEVFSVTRGHGDGGKPNPFLESKLKTKATTRNWNVIKEIANQFGN